MIKKIEIMGIGLDDYTVREAIRQVEGYLEDHTLNTIESISVDMLIAAQTDRTLKDVIASLQLALIGEQEILKVTDNASRSRLMEISKNDFFTEFFKRAERNKKSIFLLGESGDAAEKVRERLLAEFPKLLFCGECILAEPIKGVEAAINDMNATSPDIILSLMSSPAGEYFLHEHKDKLHAGTWYAPGRHILEKKPRGIRAYFDGKMRLKRLKNSMKKYKEEPS